jgi:imidazolonepropionase-like amidohydrolase
MTEPPDVTILYAGRLADGTGGPLRYDAAVRIRGSRIEAVGTAADLAPRPGERAQELRFPEQCLIPGLIDAHTHLSLAGDGRAYPEMFQEPDEMMVLIGAMNLRRHLAAGITTLRDHGARNRVGFFLKEGLARGYIHGPRLLVSGRPITCTQGHFWMCNEIADGEEEMRKSVRRLVHEGADYIKIMASGGGTAGTLPGRPSYSEAELRAAVHEAHAFGRLTAAHCRAKESMLRAIHAGLDVIEHAEFLDPDGVVRYDPKIAEMMLEAGIYVSPTIQAVGYPTILLLQAKREREGLTPAETEALAGAERRLEARLDVFRRMLDAGLLGRMVPGTDSGVGNLTFGHLDYDLQLMVRGGLTPAQALEAATRISAEASGLSDLLGTIEPGKEADLTVLDGDPTQDVSAFSRVAAVFQGGRRVS